MKSFLAILACACALAGTALVRAAGPAGLPEPLKTVTDKYLVIQNKLATDSFDGVTAAAGDMKKALAGDKTHAFAPDFSRAVDQLAAATDLHSARLAFESVSSLLIATLAKDRVQTENLHSVFCPMVRAYWLQTDGKTVHNPYMGSEMSDCGSFQKQF